MSSIDDVISRSRQAGGFSKRKRFSIARTHAIQKMRRFALADPHYYILELIQSAVSNGARYIDITAGQRGMVLSYIGGGYREEELSQLFDFLFAPKEDLDHAAIRSLAVGINALLLMEPEQIVVESGDGTVRGTTRIVIRGREDAVEVGRSETALNGTFIRATGLQRRKIANKSALPVPASGAREVVAIEMRCMAAPVPFLVNGDAVFGYSTMRTPQLFGYRNCVTFDEGDLYGTIGTTNLDTLVPSFKLLMSGVWIESVSEKVAEIPMGGIIAFDRLRKTADHSGIVRDEVYEQLWVRLQPYIKKVIAGDRRPATFDVTRIDDKRKLSPAELRSVLTSSNAAVIVPAHTTPESNAGILALRIAKALGGGVVLRMPDSELAAVRVLAGPDTQLIRPDLKNTNELSFYQQAVIADPTQPWLTAPIDVDPIPLAKIEESVDRLGLDAVDLAIASTSFKDAGEARVKIFTPSNEQAGSEFRARVITADRLVWEGPLPGRHPGHVVDIRLQDLTPRQLMAQTPSGKTVAETVALGVSSHLAEALVDATRRAIESLVGQRVIAGSTSSRIVLSMLAGNTVKRVRGEGRDATIELVLETKARGVDLRTVPIARTLCGDPVSIANLEAMLAEQNGLVYGVVPTVEASLGSLDDTRILDLDLEAERDIIAIVGEGSYVRVNDRDVIASYGSVRCLDLAYGLKSYPEFPLLVAGEPPRDPKPRAECVEHLVRDLLRLTQRDHDSEERRRNASRHLMWFVLRGLADDEPDYGARDAEIFVDAAGARFSYRAIADRTQFVMLDGVGLDVAAGGPGIAFSEEATAPGSSFAMNPFLFHLLKRRGDVRSSFDFDFASTVTDSEQTHSMIATAPIEEPGMVGEVGLSAVEPADPAIVVVEPGYARVHLMRSLARSHGLVGRVRITDSAILKDPGQISIAIQMAARAALRMVIAKLPELRAGTPDRVRAETALLAYAGRNTMVSVGPTGQLDVRVFGSLAERILEIPLFIIDQPSPVSAMHLLNTFARQWDGASDWNDYLGISPETPAHLLAWLKQELSVENVVMPASGPAAPATEHVPASRPTKPERLDVEQVTALLEYWLNELRTDEEARTSVYFASSGRIQVEPTGVPRAVSWQDISPWSNQYGDLPSSLTLNAGAPIVRWVLRDGLDSPEPFAWLLLSAYAFMNDALGPITNTHESELIAAVADRLTAGDLWFA